MKLVSYLKKIITTASIIRILNQKKLPRSECFLSQKIQNVVFFHVVQIIRRIKKNYCIVKKLFFLYYMHNFFCHSCKINLVKKFKSVLLCKKKKELKKNDNEFYYS